MYEGMFSNGAKTGVGKKYYPSGKLMFEGFLQDSKWTGFGRKYFEHNPNGTATP
jgi:antitoxin component YwqK of YwqJK toxin-antitoxin module